MIASTDTGRAEPRQDGRPRGSRSVQCLLTFLGHVGYLLSLVVLVMSAVVLLPLTPFPRLRRRVAGTLLRRYLAFFSRVVLPATHACRVVEVTGLDSARSAGAVVYTANHRSSIDAILLIPLLPPAALIIKARHVRKPAYACLVHFFDFVSVEAGVISQLRASMDRCRSLLADGMNLLVFPEGRRASAGTLMPFADFAFRMAVEQRAPIVPVVIHGDRPFLNRQKGSYFPPETVQFRIHFLEPISTETERDPVRLSNLVSRRMADALAELDRVFLKPIPSGGLHDIPAT